MVLRLKVAEVVVEPVGRRDDVNRVVRAKVGDSLNCGSPVRLARNPTRQVVPPSKASPVSMGAAP